MAGKSDAKTVRMVNANGVTVTVREAKQEAMLAHGFTAPKKAAASKSDDK